MANSLSTSPVSIAKKGGGKSTGPGRSGGKRRMPVRSVPEKGRANLTNVGQMLAPPPMQVSQQGVPYKYIVPPADPGEDPGYLRPPTQQDIDYGERLQRAMAQKETGLYPTGMDPVLAEQRITAAERQPHGPGWKEDIIDPLRREQYGASATQNVGDFLKEGYQDTLGKMVPFAHLPGGGIWKSKWSNRPNEALPMRRANILRGEGTIADKSRAFDRREAEYRHKYYGAPEPGPRKSNVYDELGMPQPGPDVSDYDVGQRDVPPYLREMGLKAEQELGPYKVPPPGSELGLPAGALITRGLSTAPYLDKETRDLIKGGFPVQDLPPGVQRFIKNTMEKPSSFIDLSGGRDREGKEEKSEEKETFNLLKFLMGLLGLTPQEEKKEVGKSYQPQRQRALMQTKK
ncbi:hypothetical protein KAW18_01330 [candidate division WOR-3 bacterium]|nr:hypothetical protein [candidate division WOR-3 bacterium]